MNIEKILNQLKLIEESIIDNNHQSYEEFLEISIDIQSIHYYYDLFEYDYKIFKYIKNFINIQNIDFFDDNNKNHMKILLKRDLIQYLENKKDSQK